VERSLEVGGELGLADGDDAAVGAGDGDGLADDVGVALAGLGSFVGNRAGPQGAAADDGLRERQVGLPPGEAQTRSVDAAIPVMEAISRRPTSRRRPARAR
jgi:hypothetical protein